MRDSWCLVKLVSVLLSLTSISAQRLRSPSNLTRTVGETDIFIPCPYEFGSSPPIWRINGTDYSSITLPSIYSQTLGGLFINEVTHCLDQTTFQCIDTSSDGIVGQESSVGVLSVVPTGVCDEDLSSALTEDMELNHRLIKYTTTNITLAWKIYSENSNCSISQLQSCPQPSSNSVNVNITTTSTMYTIQSEQLRTSESLETFTLSSLSDPPGMNCPRLDSALKFNINETNMVPVLLSNTYCSCVEIPCEQSQGVIHVALANPNPGQRDIICNAALSESDSNLPCYYVHSCNSLSMSGYPPFFRICETPMDRSRCSICFQSLDELNGARLDFFGLSSIDRCAEYLYNRLYFKSIMLNVTAGSANFTLDTTSGEICFSSISQDCELTNLTHYNFSITDITGNLAFINEESVPESTCVTLGSPFLSQCSPFVVFVQPINDNIEYKSISKKVYIDVSSEFVDDNKLSEVCSCLNTTIQLHLTTRNSLPSYSFVIDYTCSSLYLTPITITINVGGGMSAEYRVMCENGSISINNTDCQTTFNISGEWTSVNGSSHVNCQPLASTEFVAGSCPTTSPTPNNPTGTVVGVVLSLVFIIALVVVTVILIIILRRRKTKQCNLDNVVVSVKRDSAGTDDYVVEHEPADTIESDANTTGPE